MSADTYDEEEDNQVDVLAENGDFEFWNFLGFSLEDRPRWNWILKKHSTGDSVREKVLVSTEEWDWS